MADIVRRLVWFAVVATAAFFTIFAVLGNFAAVNAQNAGPVAIHDSLSAGIHHLNGILSLPLSCDELSVGVEKIGTYDYLLAFTTWQDPSIACPETPTPRAFETVAFAPSVGVNFIATLNGRTLPITVIPDIATSTAL